MVIMTSRQWRGFLRPTEYEPASTTNRSSEPLQKLGTLASCGRRGIANEPRKKGGGSSEFGSDHGHSHYASDIRQSLSTKSSQHRPARTNCFCSRRCSLPQRPSQILLTPQRFSRLLSKPLPFSWLTCAQP